MKRSLKMHPIPNGHLQRLLGMLEKSADDQVHFQGTMLEGCLDGVHKRAAATRTGSFKATKAEAIGLCLNGLEDRFSNLLIAQTSGDKPSSNSTTDVVRGMLVFNVDAWPTNPQDLVVFSNQFAGQGLRRPVADIVNKNALSPGLSKYPSPCRDSVGTTDFCSSV